MLHQGFGMVWKTQDTAGRSCCQGSYCCWRGHCKHPVSIALIFYLCLKHAFPSIQCCTWAGLAQINWCSLPLSRTFCFPHRVAAFLCTTHNFAFGTSSSVWINKRVNEFLLFHFLFLFKLAVGWFFLVYSSKGTSRPIHEILCKSSCCPQHGRLKAPGRQSSLVLSAPEYQPVVGVGNAHPTFPRENYSHKVSPWLLTAGKPNRRRVGGGLMMGML